MPQLNAQALADALQSLPGWEVSGGQLSRVFMFGNFVQAIAFVNRLADAAERAQHHPDVDIRYNRVVVSLVTHDEGGITEKDVTLAHELAGLAA